MSDIERIPDWVLEANRLRVKREVAALLISCLAQTGMSLEQVDAKIGKEHGYAFAYITGLINGTSKALDILSDLTFAMDAEIKFAFERVTPIFSDEEPKP